MTGLRINNLTKIFHTSNGVLPVLKDVCLTIATGEVVAIRGDNGSGKTTLLNIIAGIDKATSGEIQFNDAQETVPKIGYVQQDYTSSLLPWFNVMENIAVPLRIHGVGRQLRFEKATQVLKKLDFNELPLDKHPYQLSGGQKQRVAIARALLYNPSSNV